MNSTCSWCGAEDGVLWLIGLLVFIAIAVLVAYLLERRL